MAFKEAGSGYGGTGVTGLGAAVKQLQGMKQVVATGAAANANVAVAGATVDFTPLFVYNITDAAMVVEKPAYFAAGQIRFPTANTTGKQLLITYVQ